MPSLLDFQTNPMKIFFTFLLLHFTGARSIYNKISPNTEIDYEKYLYQPGPEVPMKNNFNNGNQPSPRQNKIDIISPVSAIDYDKYLYHPEAEVAMKNSDFPLGLAETADNRDPFPKENSFYKPNNVPVCREHEYAIEQILGRGADGVVYKVVHLATGVVYARKESVLDPIKIASLQEEIIILSRLKGTGITANIHCSEKQGKYFIMEYLVGITLETELMNPTLKIANHNERFLYFSRKMANIYSHLHELGIVHLDSHPRNWVFHPSTQQLHLIDFGRAKDLRHRIPESTSSYRSIQQTPSPIQDIQFAGIMWECMNIMMLLKVNYGYALKALYLWKGYIQVLPPSVQIILKKMAQVSPSSQLSFSEVISYLH